MKKAVYSIFICLLFAILLTSCGSENAKAEQSVTTFMDISYGTEISNYDTHSGNGDGTSCIAYSFEGEEMEEQIKEIPEWNEFPLDDTARAIIYGIYYENGDESIQIGPYLTNEGGEALLPQIESGYYLLTDRQEDGIINNSIKEVLDKTPFEFSDIICRSSFNFTLWVYDSDAKIMYCCEVDT